MTLLNGLGAEEVAPENPTTPAPEPTTPAPTTTAPVNPTVSKIQAFMVKQGIPRVPNWVPVGLTVVGVTVLGVLVGTKKVKIPNLK